jgi:hypothetical protein
LVIEKKEKIARTTHLHHSAVVLCSDMRSALQLSTFGGTLFQSRTRKILLLIPSSFGVLSTLGSPPICLFNNFADGKFQFLDVKMMRVGHRLENCVYRKPAHSDRYLHFNSYHANTVHEAVGERNDQQESLHLKDSFANHPLGRIIKLMSMDHELLKNLVEKDISKVLFLHYADSLYQKLKNLLRK